MLCLFVYWNFIQSISWEKGGGMRVREEMYVLFQFRLVELSILVILIHITFSLKEFPLCVFFSRIGYSLFISIQIENQSVVCTGYSSFILSFFELCGQNFFLFKGFQFFLFLFSSNCYYSSSLKTNFRLIDKS
jgi:hypothetical protein